jgi:hypothetical protein
MVLLLILSAFGAASHASPPRLSANPGKFKISIARSSGKAIGLEVRFQVTPELAGAEGEVILRPVDGQVSCAQGAPIQDASDSMSDGAVKIQVAPSSMTEGRTLSFSCTLEGTGANGTAVNAELRAWGPNGNAMGLSAAVLEANDDGTYAPSTVGRINRRQADRVRAGRLREVIRQPRTEPFAPDALPDFRFESQPASMPGTGSR